VTVVEIVVVLPHVVSAASDPYAVVVAIIDVTSEDELAAAEDSAEPSTVGVAVTTDSCLLRLPKSRRRTPPLLSRVVVRVTVCVAYSVQSDALPASCRRPKISLLALCLVFDPTSLVPLCKTSSISAIQARNAHKMEIKKGGLVG
jgi:hypothetical protein